MSRQSIWRRRLDAGQIASKADVQRIVLARLLVEDRGFDEAAGDVRHVVLETRAFAPCPYAGKRRRLQRKRPSRGENDGVLDVGAIRGDLRLRLDGDWAREPR